MKRCTSPGKWATDFDSHPSWSPAPRIDAAEGLMFLAFRPACVDGSVIEEVKRLSKDPVPSVRLQIADHLGAVRKASPKVFAELLSEMAVHDPSSTVVLSVLTNQVHRLAPGQPKEARRLGALIFGRTDLKGGNAAEVRMACVSLFLDLFLWTDDGDSEGDIRTFAEDSSKFTHETTQIVFRIREILAAGPIDPPDPRFEQARSRAFRTLEAVVSSAQNGCITLQRTHKNSPLDAWPKEDQEKLQKLAQLVDSVSTQLYFASGAFSEKSDKDGTQPVSAEQKQRLLTEADRLLDLLSDDPHPSTVHHLIEMLRSLLDISPRKVFLRINSVVKAGKAGGYQGESLAISEIVNVVNRVLADYRPLLQSDQEMREAMVSILDVFVEAGWPQAIQLTYRLDEIFR